MASCGACVAGRLARMAPGTGGEVVQKAIKIQVNAFYGTELHMDVIVTNHGVAAADLDLVFDLQAESADLNEALAGKRQQEDLVARRWVGSEGGGTLEFRCGRDDLDLASRVVLEGAGRVSDLRNGLACSL